MCEQAECQAATQPFRIKSTGLRSGMLEEENKYYENAKCDLKIIIIDL